MVRRALLLLLLLAGPAVGTVMAENFVANGRFHAWREPFPVSIPTGGRFFPESWRIAPGPGVATARLYPQPAFVSDGYGMALYVKLDNYNPFAEAGQSWLEQHIFEYDALIGQTVRLSWWQKVDGCCVGVVPMLMVNHHNGDYEFWGGGGQYLVGADDFYRNADGTLTNVVMDMAAYKARLLAAPYCLATEAWQPCEIVFQLPTGVGHVVDNNRYVLLNLNFRNPTAPGMHIAHMTLSLS